MVEKIRIALLGLWLGVMAFFSFVVAPAAFSVLPSGQLAGNVVNRTLGITELIGLVLGFTILLLLLAARSRYGKRFEAITLLLMISSTLLSRFVVSAKLHQMREQFGDISTLAKTEATRIAFDQLHQYSVWLMSFNLLAALVLLVMLIRRRSDV